jgi:hypothetical protein
MAKMGITGADEIRKNLKLAQDAIKKNVLGGMIKAAIVVQRDMETKYPVTPVEFSYLRHSFFITTVLGNRRPNRILAAKSPKGNKPKPNQAADAEAGTAVAMAAALTEVISAKNLTLVMGYGANYAIWVHEMGGSVDWSRPMSGPKWFEKSLKRNKGNMLTLIGGDARIALTKGFTATKNFPTAETRTEEI